MPINEYKMRNMMLERVAHPLADFCPFRLSELNKELFSLVQPVRQERILQATGGTSVVEAARKAAPSLQAVTQTTSMISLVTACKSHYTQRLLRTAQYISDLEDDLQELYGALRTMMKRRRQLSSLLVVCNPP
jgi:acetylornithine/succinyldiaminopimelate/putrescine aminotransferase